MFKFKHSIQYLQDNNGTTAAVLIPIDEWNRITEKYNDLEEIPQWQKDLIDDRLKHLKKNSQSMTSLEDFLTDIETKNV